MSDLFAPIAPRRKRTDIAMRALFAIGTILAVTPLVLVVYYLVRSGIGSWSWSFFTTDPTGRFIGEPGGIRSAILGTIEMVALATLIAVPLGIAIAVYLVDYGKRSLFANTVRYFIDVMTGVPSIVFGLFVYIVLILSGGTGGFAGWKGSVALALLMLPIVTRSSEMVLNLVPSGLREAGLALGAPRWRLLLRVVIPTALPGLITGALLAIARAAGETAPLLFTAFAVNATNFDPSKPTNALPTQIFNDVRQAQDVLVDRAWGGALTLVALILILTLAARWVARRSNVR